MKNWKHWAFVAMVAIVGIAFIGCKGDETTGGTQETPKVRPAEKITFGTDNALFTMVSSTKALTNEQWASVKAKLTTALDSTSKRDANTVSACTTLFAGLLNVELTETQEGYNYKLDLDAGKILLNANYVISATAEDLFTKIFTAVSAVFDDSIPQTDGRRTVPDTEKRIVKLGLEE